MSEVLIGFITDEKYGKIAHFVNLDNKSIFYRVVDDRYLNLYEEIKDIEYRDLISRMEGDLYEFKSWYFNFK